MTSSLLLMLVACNAAFAHTQVPATMTHVVSRGKPCTSPFACIEAVTVKTPKPSLGEVLVRMTSASVNPSDLDTEEKVGALQGTLGVDFAGVVVELGPGTRRLKVGDLVWGVTVGSYATYVVAIEAVTGVVPPGLNASVAGTVPEVATTSLQCLQKMGAPWPRERNVTVVITSGTGGTGFIGVQLAKALGAGHIITSTSGAANIAFAKSLGADQVFDYEVQDIFDAGALPDNSVDLVYDNYGAKGTADKAMPKIRPGGVFLLLPGGENGALSKHPKPGVKQINFGLMNFVVERKDVDMLAKLYEGGLWNPYVDPRSPFHLSEVAQAFSLSATGSAVPEGSAGTPGVVSCLQEHVMELGAARPKHAVATHTRRAHRHHTRCTPLNSTVLQLVSM